MKISQAEIENGVAGTYSDAISSGSFDFGRSHVFLVMTPSLNKEIAIEGGIAIEAHPTSPRRMGNRRKLCLGVKISVAEEC